jgi:hypothetical protein
MYTVLFKGTKSVLDSASVEAVLPGRPSNEKTLNVV